MSDEISAPHPSTKHLSFGLFLTGFLGLEVDGFPVFLAVFGVLPIFATSFYRRVRMPFKAFLVYALFEGESSLVRSNRFLTVEPIQRQELTRSLHDQ